MFDGGMCVDLLMSPFRILLALNTITLILDTVGHAVNTVLITTDILLNRLFYLTGNKF